MSRFLKNWKYIFSVSLILLYFLLFFVLTAREIELPSEGWSRGILIRELKNQNIINIMKDQNVVTVPVVSNDTFLIFWYEDRTINYTEIGNEGNIILKRKLDLNIDKIQKMESILKNNIVYLYSIENKNLYRYEINWKDGKVLSKRQIDKSVKNLIVEDDLIIYNGNNFVKIMDNCGIVKTIKNGEVDRIEAVKDGNTNLYYLVLVEREKDGSKALKYIVYDAISGDIKEYVVNRYPFILTNSIDHVDIEIEGEKVNILVSIKDSKFNVTTVNVYSFLMKDISKVSVDKLDLGRNVLFIKFIKDNDRKELGFIASVADIIGKKTKTYNLFLFTLDNGVIKDKKKLTKTRNISINPELFELGKDTYLQWVDLTGNSKKIFIAGSNAQMINYSTKLKGYEWFELLMTALTTLMSISYLSIIPFVYTFLPTGFFILLISTLKLTWSERNPKKVLHAAMVIHVVFKLLFSIKHILNNWQIKIFLPFFLKNPVIFTILLILNTAISIYCTQLYIKDKKEKNIWALYIFFSIIDTTIFVFLTFPYYL